MGEIMFNYTVDNAAVKHETMFKYWYNMSKEQNFAYQRFVALFDARTFNKPVAITKVATGFIDLHQLFVIQDGHSMLIQNQDWSKSRKSMIPRISSDIFGENIDELQHLLPDRFFARHKLGIMDFEPNLFGNSGNVVVNMYRSHIGGEKDWTTSLWKTKYMGTGEENIVYTDYQNKMTHRRTTETNFLSSCFGKPFDNIVNYFSLTDMMAGRIPKIWPVSYFIANDEFAFKISSYTNFYSNIYLSVQNKVVNIKKDFNVFTIEQDFNTSSVVFGFRPMPYNNIFNSYYVSTYGSKMYKFKDFSISKNTLKATYDSNHNASKEIPNGNHIENLFLSTGNINTNINPNTLVFTFGKVSGYLSLDSFGITPNRVLNITNGVHTSDGDDVAKYIPGWFGNSDGGDESSIIDNVFAKDNGKGLFGTNTFMGCWDGGHDAQYIPYHFSATDFGRNIREMNSKNIAMYKINSSFKEIPSSFFITKGTVGMYLPDEDVISVHKVKNRLNMDEEKYKSTWIHKVKKRLNRDEEKYKSIWVHKVLHEMSIGIYGHWVDKLSVDSRDIINSVFAYKIPYSTGVQYSSTTADLLQKHTAIFKQGVDFIKKYVVTTVDDSIDWIIKTALSVDFYDASGYDILIIPISKIKKQVFIDRIDDMFSKIARPVYVTNQSFASAIPRPLGFPDLDLFCDKKEHEVYIQYKNVFITKNKVRSTMFNDEFVSKMSRDVDFYTQSHTKKEYISLQYDGDNWNNKSYYADKLYRPVFTIQEEALTQIPHKTTMHDDVFIDKIPTLCHYSYGFFVNKEKYNTIINQQDVISKMNHDVHIMDISPVIRPIREFYYNQVYSAPVLRTAHYDDILSAPVPRTMQSPLYNQIQGVNKIYNEVKIAPNDFGNWAWVYEEEDSLNKPEYTIDELLLPENDTRYEDFQDIMFDKKKLKPKNPVKKIDDTTFIGKYPIKHPLPDYSDVGVVYLDVKTDVMYEVFLKFYRIWQSKLFEFSTMTMTQSVSKMLDYLYTWIMLYYPEERIEEALRVFRQIRWYGEMAIIQNSQYIISYEYEDLKSKLNTGRCAIPNDIDPDENGNVSNPTMIVDATNAVIRNNPAYIGISEARVQFTIDIKKNTTFSFSLINTIGSVNIYIDGVLVDTVSTSKLNLTYPLNFTGRPIVVDIIKTKQNNLNQMFCIGNIIVAKGTFKDLSIEFDPTLKAGNKPLDEIAKKMIQYANEHDNVTVAYENILKANVGISETYKRMVEYWEIHHQNKSKGKRLTIKQV